MGFFFCSPLVPGKKIGCGGHGKGGGGGGGIFRWGQHTPGGRVVGLGGGGGGGGPRMGVGAENGKGGGELGVWGAGPAALRCLRFFDPGLGGKSGGPEWPSSGGEV